MMCPEEDYSTVVETLAIDDILKLIIRVGIEETKSHNHAVFTNRTINKSHLWQSQVETEHYSIGCFDHITMFKVL